MENNALRVNQYRLWQSMEELAKKGATSDGGVCRLALTDTDREARDLLYAWLQALDLIVQIDQVGNILAIRPGTESGSPVLMGSHLDTVSTGGRFDGSAGVLAGLEILRILEEHERHTRLPLGLVVFTNEEGARYTTDMMGSQAFCGQLSIDQVYAIQGFDGSFVGDELKRIGYAGDQPCGRIRPQAYLELHIEQGQHLEQSQLKIGAVEAITGITWLEVIFYGAANHAGTTPMNGRHDAGLAAARVISILPELAAPIRDQRATSGRISFLPGGVNIIPKEARFTIDLRNGDPEGLMEAEKNLREIIAQTAQRTGCRFEIMTLGHVPPQACDLRIVEIIERSASSLDYSFQRMTSGAGHDAQIMATICPTAMIFIPSREGISHSPEEYSSPEDLAAGANVLLRSALCLTD